MINTMVDKSLAMVDVGFKNYISFDRIVYILKPGSSKTKWLTKEALAGRKIINCTQGKKVGSIVILNTKHLALSPLKFSSIIKRLKAHPQIAELTDKSSISQDLLDILNSEQ